jgi:ClpP class serine protease
MPNWNSVLREIALDQSRSASAFDRVRQRYLKQLARHTGRNVIAYYSGFLSKPNIEGTQLTDEDKNGFMLGIHGLKRERGLDLILHTPGGDGKATEALVDYLRSMFDKDIRAIIPQLAMSAGTMIACSCKSIVMGKQSSLGPVDPQFQL